MQVNVSHIRRYFIQLFNPAFALSRDTMISFGNCYRIESIMCGYAVGFSLEEKILP